MRRSTREHGHAVTVEKATPAPSQALRAPKHSELAGTTRGGVATIPKRDNQSLRVGARERESGGGSVVNSKRNRRGMKARDGIRSIGGGLDETEREPEAAAVNKLPDEEERARL